MELEQLKQQWSALADRVNSLETQNEQLRKQLSNNKNLSLRDRLVRTYRIFTIIPFVLIPTVFSTFKACDFPSQLSFIFAALFLIEGAGNYYLLRLLLDLDFTRDTVRKALSDVIKIQSTRRWLQYAYCVLTLPVILYAFYVFGKVDMMLVWSALTGGIIGGIIGYMKDRNIRRTLKAMRSELEEFDAAL